MAADSTLTTDRAVSEPFTIRPPLPGRVVHWVLSAVIWVIAIRLIINIIGTDFRATPAAWLVLVWLIVAGVAGDVMTFRRGIRVSHDRLDICDRFRRVPYLRADIAGFELPPPGATVRVLTMRLVDGREVKLRATIRSILRNPLVEENHRRLTLWLHPPLPTESTTTSAPPAEASEAASSGTAIRASFVIRMSRLAWRSLVIFCVAILGGIGFVWSWASDTEVGAVTIFLLLIAALTAAAPVLAWRIYVRADADQLVLGNYLTARTLMPETIRSFSVMRFGPFGGVLIATLVDGEIVLLRATRRLVSTPVLDEFHEQLTHWLGRTSAEPSAGHVVPGTT